MPWELPELSGLPVFASQLLALHARPLLAPMSFFPAPSFSAVATMVGYNPALPTSVPLTQALVPPPLPLPTVATTLDGKPVEVMASPAFHSSDPVTKAVMDNIMGKLPTKKQPVICKCEVCNLEFSGQVVMDTHLAGAKHAKKVKSQEILKQLQSSGQSFTRDEKTKILKCEVCDVVVNSSQQLQTHLTGNKHKQKAMKKGSSVAKPSGAAAPKTEASTSSPENGGSAPQSVKGDAAATPATGNGEVPPGVQKLPEATGSKAHKYFCDTCNVSLNSEIQLEQHLTSRKHKERMMNGGKSRQRPTPYWKRQRGGYGMHGMKKAGVKVPKAVQYSQPLTNNFVSGGAML
ncbi:zinc finger protein 346-like isoform X2 [Bacillus rossius redtenbacheri]|uniref:zinc finger protein 346-like isoform X2 n=2 Tax=Bacillus rossius redtenbacheri TaxID=93214 RepID=UPI002FDE690B